MDVNMEKVHDSEDSKYHFLKTNDFKDYKIKLQKQL